MAAPDYRAQGIDAGTAEILEIQRLSPEVEGWPQFDLREAEFQQCDTCNALDFDSLAATIGPDLGGVGQRYHESWETLKISAIAGCHTRRLFHMVKLHEDQKTAAFPRAIENGMSSLMLARQGSTMTLNGPGSWGLRFSWFTLPDCLNDQLSDKGTEFETQTISTSRPVEDSPGSEEGFSRTRTWVESCLKLHKHCKTNDKVKLPTRVLDVTDFQDTGKVKLLETKGLQGKYIALSHCWGGANGLNREVVRTCTALNYEELQNGLEVSKMPRNFQDAVLVCIKLKVQYLWVDSYCIMQDSHDDWSRESSGMSDVYGNSYLTIYASSAANSDQGFLRLKTPDRYLMTRLCPVPRYPEHWIWIRWPPSDLVWSLDDHMGKLWDRGWAFQELVLPPRILEYGPVMMNWRCNTQHNAENENHFRGNTHDGFKELLWILALPDSGKLSSEKVPSHPTFADHHASITIYERWNQMIEGFAGRELTNELDKLPAVSGLAAKIQQITGDEYLAGIWKRDIAAGLCWGARFTIDLVRPATYIAPSWSWASTQGNVRYNLGERTYNVELIDYNVVTEPLNHLGRVVSGSITVSGPMRTIDLFQHTVYVDQDWDYEVQRLAGKLVSNGMTKRVGRSYQYALKDQKNVVDPLGAGILKVSLDTPLREELTEVWLLRLEVARKGGPPKKWDANNVIPEGIILESVPEEEGVYKRIGVYDCIDAMAEWIEGPEHSTLLGWEKRTIRII